MRQNGIRNGILRTTAALLLVAGVPVAGLDLEATTNFWTGRGATTSWNNPANWLAGVPAANQHAAITQAVAVVLDRPSSPLASFTMTAGTLTFANWTTCLRAETVDLHGGTLTLPPPFTDIQMSNRVWIVCANLTVASNATINVNALGYAREHGPGIVGGTYGGSYGGRGNGESGWVNRPAIYGSVSEPVDPGSGGWSTVSTDGGINTGAGGGAIRIDASGAVAVHGTLTANGGNGPVTHASGGSGGSILIRCRTFGGSPSGLLSARGGNGNNRGGAAGGGRIAVIYDSAAQAAMTPVNPGVRFNAAQAADGGWAIYAEPGTLYFPDTAFLSGAMTTQWQGGDIRIPGFTSWAPDSLSVAGIFGLPGVTNLSVAGDLDLLSGGTLSLDCAPTNEVLSPYGLMLTVGGVLSISTNARLVLGSHIANGAVPWVSCGRLFVAAGGMIDADSKGYGPHGESAYPGPGGGAVSTYGVGASHGGQGSPGNGAGSCATQPYGDCARPLTPGSAGGGGSDGLGGYGGGVIAISAASTAEIHGTLTADGGDSGSHGGTGSGGSILVQCETFLGSATGLIRARGGAQVTNSGGSGGGGRIAIVYDPVAQVALPQPNPGVAFSTAPGYTGANPFLAEPGTLHLPDALFLSSQMGLQWQDVNLVIPGFTDWEVAGLQIAGQFFINGLRTLRVTGDMAVNNGGQLTLFAHPTQVVDREIECRLAVSGNLVIANGGKIVTVADPDTGDVPCISCGSLDVQSGGKIVADNRGFND